MKSSGFTLVELAITLFLAGIVAAATLPNYIDQWNQKKTDIAAAEIWTLVEGAQRYMMDTVKYGDPNTGEGKWPNQDNPTTPCARAINTLRTEGLIAGVKQKSLWGSYITRCPLINGTRNFQVRLDTNNADYALVLTNTLPNTELRPNSTDTIVTSVSTPVIIPALKDYLRRDGSEPMTGNLNMAGNKVIGLSELLLTNNDRIGIDGGGHSSIELSGSNATNDTPYIDFHFKKDVDYNTRIINNGDKRLSIKGDGGTVTLNVEGNIETRGMTSTGSITTAGMTSTGNIATTGMTSTGSITTAGMTSTGNIATTGMTSTGSITTAGMTSSGNIATTGMTSTGNITTAGVTSTGIITAPNLTVGTCQLETNWNTIADSWQRYWFPWVGRVWLATDLKTYRMLYCR